MRKIVPFALILTVVRLHPMAAQTAGATHPLEVKTGLWEFTITTKATSEPTPELMASYPPTVRAQVLAGLKAEAANAKETVQQRRACIAPENLERGDFFSTGSQTCPADITSSSQKLEVAFHCGSEQISRFERIDSERLKGTMQTIVKTALMVTTTQTLAGRWIREECATNAQDISERQQQREAKGIAAGANREVLSFLPYIPPRPDGGSDEGHFGHAFVYYWNNSNRKIPIVSYIGGFRDGPPATADAYFHGTDGHFVYVSLNVSGSICGDQVFRYKIDKAGAPTRISAIPTGLVGGMDEHPGAAPCQNYVAEKAAPKPSTEPRDLSFLLPPQPMVPVQEGYYVAVATPTDHWPPNNARLLHLYVKGNDISVMEVVGRGGTPKERLWVRGPYTSNPFRGEIVFHGQGGEITKPIETAFRPDALYVGSTWFHRLSDAAVASH